MLFRRALRLLSAAFLTLFAAHAVAQSTPAAAPTIEQLAAFPRMSSFSISPDGRHLAALEARGEDRVILVWRANALNEAPTVIGSREMKIQSVRFLKDDVLGVTLWQPLDFRGDSVIKTFVGKFFLTDLEGRNWREPLPLPRAASRAEQLAQSRTSPSVLDVLPNDPHHILLVNNVGARAGDVYRVNVHTNRAERVQRIEEDVAGYQTDLQGAIRARTKLLRDNIGAYIATEIRNPQTNVWEEHFRSYVRDRDVNEIIGFTADPNIALLRSNVGRDKTAIFEYDITARRRGDLIFEHRFFEAEDVAVDPYTGEHFGEILALSYAGPREGSLQWVSPRLQALDAAIRQALNIRPDPITFTDPATGESATTTYDTDNYYEITDYTPDFSTVVLYIEGPDLPRSFYLLRDGQLSLLSRTYPDLNPAVLGQTRLIYYKARDGLDIPAFLTTPNAPECGAGPWRTVVHPHGGPWARDDMSFDYSMWVPLMASRCIAVLRPQYRGSDGWGRRLWVAGDAEWGQKMQDDKDDGAQWLIDNQIARPGHIAMFGFSYGGYASMAAAVRPNGFYRCAIAGAGVSDIDRIWKDFYLNPYYREAQGPFVDGLSPLSRADQIQIPIMVYHGERDQTVPLEQSDWFVSRARQSGQPVEYHVFADYAHGPAWTREIMGNQLRIIDDYFREGCGGGGL